MRTEFILAGVVLGLLAAASRERIRRRRLRTERRMAHGSHATAVVERVWPKGRDGRRREIELRYVDEHGRSRDAVTELNAAEAGAVGLRVGGRLEIRYLPTDPGDVLVVRPRLLDDHVGVSVLAGVMVFALCVAIGALVR